MRCSSIRLRSRTRCSLLRKKPPFLCNWRCLLAGTGANELRSLKLKRAPIAKKFRDEISRLYEELEADPSLLAKAKL